MNEKFSVKGMTCSACSSGIERTLQKEDGVLSAEVSLLAERLTVEYDENKITREEICARVRSLGYGIGEYREENDEKKKKSALKPRFFVSLCFLFPLMYLSMGKMLGFPTPNEKISAVLQGVLALFVVIVNFRFFTSGFFALLKRVPNMDTLVALGSGISFVYSAVLTVLILLDRSHGHLFYESAAMILTLVTLGKWLEDGSKNKTRREVEKLISVMPNVVSVLKDGKEEKIEFSLLQVGDILIVRQGDYVPVDGKIVRGNGFLNRSAITGESMPVEVKVGDSATSADVVLSGYLEIRSEKVGKDTTLSSIVRMVKEAGASKAPIQKVADKIAGIFVPFVCIVAIFTFTVWLFKSDFSTAANYAVSVLVISCPCALGLATPVAVMTATGRGMSLGILFKDAEALQKTEKINCVLLDKTATLTEGKPRVAYFKSFVQDFDALSVAVGIEEKSNHPIADCIKEYALKQGASPVNVENYDYTVGQGARGTVNGETYYLGNEKLLPTALKKTAQTAEKQSGIVGTALFLATEKKLCAVFVLSDALKESSVRAVRRLKEKGVRLGILTGDNERVAKSIAEEVGISDYFASALPKDKADAVERVRAVGGFVAMVGDGINDSPALKRADVGIAIGTGTDIAIESGDIVLAHGNLEGVAEAIELSKATVKNIKENLFWAFFYNVVAIPIAAGAFAFANIRLNPMISAACMSASSLFVVSNALRLTRFHRKKKNKEIGEKKMIKVLSIEGMMCMHCVARVEKALLSVNGVKSVNVELKKNRATVETEDDVESESLKKAVEEQGYTVKEIK